MVSVIRYARLAAIVFAALALVAAPSVAQEEEEQQEAGVTCDPANPPAGSTTTCSATGLEPASAFMWAAQFTDGSETEGEGEADPSGTGTFEVEIPDSAPIGGYQVTVTGTSAEGEEYEESHRGLIVPAGGGDEESPSPEDDESPDEDDGEDPGAGQEEPPAGGVATGGGGTAGGGPGVLALLGGLLGLGLAGGLLLRRRLLS